MLYDNENIHSYFDFCAQINEQVRKVTMIDAWLLSLCASELRLHGCLGSIAHFKIPYLSSLSDRLSLLLVFPEALLRWEYL